MRILAHKNHEPMMNVNIQSIHFDISARLTEFINKKAARLERHYPDITSLDFTLSVIKPESALNKEAVLRLKDPRAGELVATKKADSFEQAIDEALEALDHQLAKAKEKR